MTRYPAVASGQDIYGADTAIPVNKSQCAGTEIWDAYLGTMGIIVQRNIECLCHREP